MENRKYEWPEVPDLNPEDVEFYNKKPKCKLVGTDGNVFALAGRVSKALKDAGQFHRAKEFSEKVFQCGSYDEALQLMMKYAEVS